MLSKEHQLTTGTEKYKKREVRSTGDLSGWWAVCLGAYPGVGAYHSIRKNSYMGAYPGVGACPGYYGTVQC